MKRRSSGFTLIELMIVVAIIIVIMTLLLPSLSKAKEEAKLLKCGANLHSIGLAFATYAQQNRDLMPQSAVYTHLSPNDVAGNYALGDRDRGWLYPATLNPLPLSWPEALYIDGDIATGPGNKGGNLSARKTGDDPLNGGTWQYPISGREALFVCPCHPNDQRRGDGNTERGYGMAWCATSDLTPVNDLSGNFLRFTNPVFARLLVPHHVVATEGNVLMGSPQGGYLQPATNDYGIFQRHKRNSSKGANYLMADGSVTWSDLFASTPSPITFRNDYSSAANRQAAAKAGYIFAHGVSAQK